MKIKFQFAVGFDGCNHYVHQYFIKYEDSLAYLFTFRVMIGISDLPSDIIVKIFEKLMDMKQVARNGRVCRLWLLLSRSNILWRKVEFSGKARLSLHQLTTFIKSSISSQVRSLSVEGYVVRPSNISTYSTVTNHVLGLMSKKMLQLNQLTIFNANIMNISLKMMPKTIEFLSLFGCIIEYNALIDLNNSSTLPLLKHLILNYVHNLSSNSESFTSILRRRNLLSIELRHCYRITNQDLMKISYYLTNLRVLNLSEINVLDDSVIQCLVNIKCLNELYLAFTSVSDSGICSLINNDSVLRLLDIRGCPRITGRSLIRLAEMKSLQEVWILRRMEGCEKARKTLADSRLRVLDEVERRKMAVPQHMDFYSIYFEDALMPIFRNDVVE